jgi:hypothetical protein
VIDNPEYDEHITSPLQRQRFRSWFHRAVANGFIREAGRFSAAEARLNIDT